VGHDDASARELDEGGQDLVDRGLARHQGVVDARQVRDPEGDGLERVDQ
jgi:hypothetical protein